MKKKLILGFILFQISSCSNIGDKKQVLIYEDETIEYYFNIDESKDINSIIYDTVIVFSYDESKYDKCLYDRNSSAIVGDKVNPCYSIVNKVHKDELENLLIVLNDSSTYGGTFYSCFNSENTIAFLKQDTIVGYVTFSLYCNRMGAHPKIPVHQIKLDNYYNYRENFAHGFSVDGFYLILKELEKLGATNFPDESTFPQR